jgi:hypothetical protein
MDIKLKPLNLWLTLRDDGLVVIDGATGERIRRGSAPVAVEADALITALDRTTGAKREVENGQDRAGHADDRQQRRQVKLQVDAVQAHGLGSLPRRAAS